MKTGILEDIIGIHDEELEYRAECALELAQAYREKLDGNDDPVHCLGMINWSFHMAGESIAHRMVQRGLFGNETPEHIQSFIDAVAFTMFQEHDVRFGQEIMSGALAPRGRAM